MTEEEIQSPEDLIQTFAVCENFPQNRAAVLALAQALVRASKDFHIPMLEIVQTCSDASRYCPAPRDIRNMALAIRDERRQKAEGNRNAQWEAIYGPPDPDWPAKFMGTLATAPHEDQRRALHIRAVRDALFYTEGAGTERGDREFWIEAHQRNCERFPELVAQVRAAGGWQNERELQADWIDVAWQPPVKAKHSRMAV